MARQHGTNGKRVENNGGLGAVDARGEPRVEGEGEWKAEAEMRAGVRAEAGIMLWDVGSGAETVWWKGVPLTVPCGAFIDIWCPILTEKMNHRNSDKMATVWFVWLCIFVWCILCQNQSFFYHNVPRFERKNNLF